LGYIIIVLYDSNQKISRNHAILKIDAHSNLFIRDISTNGTYVNGVKINPNVDFPLTKKDNVVFANAQTLDCSLIEFRKVPILRIIYTYELFSILSFIILFIA